MDFLDIRVSRDKKGTSVYPVFLVGRYEDLMIRGGNFYAFWDEKTSSWTFDEMTLAQRIDELLDQRAGKIDEPSIRVQHVRDYSTGQWTIFQQFVKSLPDNYHQMDSKVLFSDYECSRDDYATRKLPYELSDQDIPAYEELVSTLYDEEERRKLEWAIGSVFCGDSKKIQKFIVLYGSAGSGKSTILNIIQKLFDGYYCIFESKSLGSSASSFSVSQFNSNPLVGIEHDGDLSKVEDNTRLNSIVSHEDMVVNEKYKSAYTMRIMTFLFIGTNRPVKITDAKSGIMRRLIYVQPSNRHIPFDRYNYLVSQIDFELGGIAKRCIEVYKELGISYYDGYRPVEMMGFTNDFYNFMEDMYEQFSRDDTVTLKAAWEAYKVYCDDANVKYPYSKRVFKSELRNYFKSFDDRKHLTLPDGGQTNVYNYYSGFLKDKFVRNQKVMAETISSGWLELGENQSVFDAEASGYPAQYATVDGRPKRKWTNNEYKLSDLDTSRLHFVKLPENHIVIDFDIRGDDGEKSLEKNILAAEGLPRTYAEVSKSGSGLHLHYIYDGDVNKLSNVYSENVEIKVFKGDSSLRRKLSLCNTEPISHISGGLPLRKEARMLNFEGLRNEKALRTVVLRNLEKKYHPGTKPSVEFIKTVLDEAYDSGMPFDLTDLRPDVMDFALNSTHHSGYCVKLVSEMKFQSAEASDSVPYEDKPITFFDVEVFPNLFVVVWKNPGSDPVKMINPSPEEIEDLCKMKLVGFNNRKYDNHILYARMMGYSNLQLYELSSRIVNGNPNSTFIDAYNLSYADIYDFSSKKQSLKKFEIELGIHHQELGMPWDEPVPEDKWVLVAEYCINDVIATEATFEARHEDFVAREILAALSGLTVNHTNRQHTERILFGNERSPQKSFVYTNLATGERSNGTKDSSCFEGYVYDKGVSTYCGEVVGEGGYVYAEPGYYENVALLDVVSMHPHSILALNLFGDKYTANFKELLDARIFIKHGEYDKASKMLGGKLAPYLKDKSEAKKLSNALKIPINSVYGLTAAKFDNKFRDIRNKDNIVAKRGALFMIDLKHAVQERGFTVAHIKTDSIKIPNATPEIIDFVFEFGSAYGYYFEYEANYEKLCLVNDAVYVAKQSTDYEGNDHPGEWSATGAQFQVPYVFKTLFSHEPISFRDLCETKSVSGNGTIYLDMNEDLVDVSEYEHLLDVAKRLSDEKKREKVTKKDQQLFEKTGYSEEALEEQIAKGHNYVFVGRAGAFCPMLPGSGGGILYRFADGKYFAVTGTKGYRWMESEVVKLNGLEDKIDKGYFKNLVDEAVYEIEKYVPFGQLVN